MSVENTLLKDVFPRMVLYSQEQGEGKRLERELLSLCDIRWMVPGDVREKLWAARSLNSHREECNLRKWKVNMKLTK